MSWYVGTEKDPEDLLAFSDADKHRLTVAEAQAYVAPDTLELARWRGLLMSGKRPYDCLMALYDMEDVRQADGAEASYLKSPRPRC